MKILFYSQSSTLYGSPTSLYNLIIGLRQINSNYDIHVIIPNDGPLADKFRESKISFSIIPHFKWVYNRDLYLKKRKESIIFSKIWYWKNRIEKKVKNLFNQTKHQNLIDEYKPDIIYANSSISPMGCIMAIKNKIPLVWHHRETLDDPITGFYLEDQNLYSRIFKNTSLHIYPSKYLKESYVGSGVQNLHKIIFNGVIGINVPEKKIIKNNIIKFGMVGRINKQKGQEAVLDLFKKLGMENYVMELHLFGDANRQKLNFLNENFKNDNVYFHGFSNHENIYNKIDFLIVNAKNESFGRVVAEANSVGVPVLAIRSGALQEIVEDGVNGFIYNSMDELSKIIMQLTTKVNLEQYYKDLSNSSFQKFRNEFTIYSYANNVSQALNKLKLK